MSKRIFGKVILSCSFFILSPVYALENGLGRTPPMGWSSWNNYHIDINEKMLQEMVDALVTTGLKEAGYIYFNIDDGWFGGRDALGRPNAHPEKFPSGMKALADYIHSKGLKAGIYSDAGSNSCASIHENDHYGEELGFYGHEQNDAALYFKEWGYDYIKIDWCGAQKLNLNAEIQYSLISKAILDTQKPVLINLCNWNFPGAWALNVANTWRTTRDIENTWESFTEIADENNRFDRFAGPGHFNDADMLQVGRGMTFEEDKAHFSLWAMMASPLILGNDIRTLSNQTKSIISNPEVIAVDQDEAGIQGKKIRNIQGLEIWLKPLGSATGKVKAVLFFNRTLNSANMTVNWQEINLSHSALVRDLWRRENLGIFNQSFTAAVPPHGVVLVKITEETTI